MTANERRGLRLLRTRAADDKKHRERRKEEHDIGDGIDDAARAYRPFFVKEIRADMRALVQRIGGAEHEDRAVQRPEKRRTQRKPEQAEAEDHARQHRRHPGYEIEDAAA